MGKKLKKLMKEKKSLKIDFLNLFVKYYSLKPKKSFIFRKTVEIKKSKIKELLCLLVKKKVKSKSSKLLFNTAFKNLLVKEIRLKKGFKKTKVKLEKIKVRWKFKVID